MSELPRLDVELLLAHTLQVPRERLYSHPEQALSLAQQQTFQQLLARRQAGEPVAYLLGYREFWSLTLEVTPDTLIPRPETELLVEKVLEKLPVSGALQVADLGTGSGAIALAIAHERSHWSLTATDYCPMALAVAQRNARRLSLNNIDFMLGNWCQALGQQRYHAIVSNPPYIRGDYAHLPAFEPLSALVGGANGLEHLQKIIMQAGDHLLPEGWLLLEHGYDQAEAVSELLVAQGYGEVSSAVDLAGIKRVTIGKKRGIDACGFS